MTMMMFDGPGGGSVALYCAIMPQTGQASVRAHVGQRRVQVIAADIVEIDVDALRERRAHRGGRDRRAFL